jgi:gamma-glutamyltranspeptidase/glutathione hydrolase
LSITDAVAAPRLHHQWMPDQVLVERGFSPELIRALTLRGHRVVEAPPGTSANSIMVTPDGFVGAADPRTRGSFAAGY